MNKVTISVITFSFLHRMVLKLSFCSRYNISPEDPEGADQPIKSGLDSNTVYYRTVYDSPVRYIDIEYRLSIYQHF